MNKSASPPPEYIAQGMFNWIGNNSQLLPLAPLQA